MPHPDSDDAGAGERAPRITSDRPTTAMEGTRSELLDDGQEEVFAYSAVERGLVEDPKALGPADLARAPKSPGSLAAPPAETLNRALRKGC